MADPRHTPSEALLKDLDYKIERLSIFIDQLDVLAFNLRQAFLILREVTHKAKMGD